jgi:hypothetical protein
MLIEHPQSWQRWYAWHPIRFFDKTRDCYVTVWFEKVWRKRASPKYAWSYSMNGL